MCSLPHDNEGYLKNLEYFSEDLHKCLERIWENEAIMNKGQRRGDWLGPLLFVVAALTAVTALLGTTPALAHLHDTHD